MVHRVSDLVEPSSNIGDSCGLPVVHRAVNPPEVSVSPDRHRDDHNGVPKKMLVPFKVPCVDVARGIQDHNDHFPEGAAKDSADRIKHFAPQMLRMLVVLGELERAKSRSDGRVNDEELPSTAEGKADEHVPCRNLEDPAVVRQAVVAAHELLNCRIALLHLLLNRVKVVAKESEQVERDHPDEPVDPVDEVVVRASNCVVNSHAVLSLRFLQTEYARQVCKGPELDAKDL